MCLVWHCVELCNIQTKHWHSMFRNSFIDGPCPYSQNIDLSFPRPCPCPPPSPICLPMTVATSLVALASLRIAMPCLDLSLAIRSDHSDQLWLIPPLPPPPRSLTQCPILESSQLFAGNEHRIPACKCQKLAQRGSRRSLPARNQFGQSSHGFFARLTHNK